MKATELTLKHELALILHEKLGLDYVTETSTRAEKRHQTDIVFFVGSNRVVLELEIGGIRRLVEGIEQAEEYSRVLNASGSITIAYPEHARAAVSSREDVKDILNSTEFQAFVITSFQRKYYPSVKLTDFIGSLKVAIERPEPTDLNTMIAVLYECVESISRLARRSKSLQSSLANEVIARLDLFKILAGEEVIEQKELESAGAELASYIVVNQILLYFLLASTLGLPRLESISTLDELLKRFKMITDVDYKAVYRIQVIGRLSRDSIPDLNRIITALHRLRPEDLPHDLLGRMFHEFLPLKTRKMFATFYTKPIAAEILASLAIPPLPEAILEPATGSGTILVATYKAVKRENPTLSHIEILKRLYAIDIMPFAAHLAALNLTLQDIESKTDKVNVGIGNSLGITPSKKYPTQLGLFDRHIARKTSAEETTDEELRVPKRMDLVIMNPPFTDSRRLTPAMLGSRVDAFSERQNYWAYFLSLSDDILAPGGHIAAVLPRLFFSGSASKEVRNWLFSEERYALTYVVRTTKEFAFSEVASFRDFLVILEKPVENVDPPKCRVIYLNASLSSLGIDQIPSLIKEIRETNAGKSIVRTADYSVFDVSQQLIRRNCRNLWPIVGFEYPENSIAISQFLDKTEQYGNGKLAPLVDVLAIPSKKTQSNPNLGRIIPRGFEAKPKHLYSAIYIARERKERPDKPNCLHLAKDENSYVLAETKGQVMRIPKDVLRPAIYSGSYLRKMRIDEGNCDYAIVEQGSFSKTLQNLTGVRIDYTYLAKSAKKCESHVLVAKRFNIIAPGTTHVAFYGTRPLVSPNTFYSIKCSNEMSKILVCWLNSMFGVIQLLQHRKETEGGYCDLLKEDLAQFIVPQISRTPKEIEDWTRKHISSDFSALSSRFHGTNEQIELDRAWMMWLEWPRDGIEEDLRMVHSALDLELKAISSAGRKKAEDTSQSTIRDFD